MSATLPPRRISASSAILLAGIILALYLCYRLAIPFLSPLVWSFTLAVLSKPLYAKLQSASASDALSAAITVFIVAALVVIPTIFVVGALLAEAVQGAENISSAAQSGRWGHVVESHPWLSRLSGLVGERLNLRELIGTMTSGLTAWSASLIRGSFTGFVNLLLIFYFLFYFLRDGHAAWTALQNMLPLNSREFAKLCERVMSTIYATVYGTVIIAALQGALGGLMFWWLEIPAPLFWGVVMGLLAVIPFLGAFVIWAPVAAYLLLDGQWQDAILLTVWGMAVIGLIDNVLYPVLVGSRLRMHTVPAFVAVVGGLLLFGTHGLILGPIIVTVSFSLVQIWRERAAVMRGREATALQREGITVAITGDGVSDVPPSPPTPSRSETS